MKLFYSGSFDPITNGHMDIVSRGLSLCDHLVIGIGAHHSKTALLSPKERKDLIEQVIKALPKGTNAKCDVVLFDGLAVDAAKKHKCNGILRGLRNGTDLDYETQMALTNRQISKGLETIFLVSTGEHAHIAANLVRQIARMGGDISSLVPSEVVQFLKAKS